MNSTGHIQMSQTGYCSRCGFITSPSSETRPSRQPLLDTTKSCGFLIDSGTADLHVIANGKKAADLVHRTPIERTAASSSTLPVLPAPKQPLVDLNPEVLLNCAKLIQNRALLKEVTQACEVVCQRREVGTYLQVCSDCAPARDTAGATSIQWVEWT